MASRCGAFDNLSTHSSLFCGRTCLRTRFFSSRDSPVCIQRMYTAGIILNIRTVVLQMPTQTDVIACWSIVWEGKDCSHTALTRAHTHTHTHTHTLTHTHTHPPTHTHTLTLTPTPTHACLRAHIHNHTHTHTHTHRYTFTCTDAHTFTQTRANTSYLCRHYTELVCSMQGPYWVVAAGPKTFGDPDFKGMPLPCGFSTLVETLAHTRSLPTA
jgi:hypothetical protein